VIGDNGCRWPDLAIWCNRRFSVLFLIQGHTSSISGVLKVDELMLMLAFSTTSAYSITLRRTIVRATPDRNRIEVFHQPR